MSQLTLSVTGMTCQNCVAHVREALAPLAGSVAVTLDPPQVLLSQPRVNFVALQSALSGTRYNLHHAPALEANPLPPVAWKTYYPLLLLTALVALTSAVVAWQQGGSWTELYSAAGYHLWMRYFMGGFFVAFAFFKLLDVPAFADAFAGYDLLAQRWRHWGYVYPFVELALGLLYLANWQPLWTNAAALGVMAFSALGVIRSVWRQERIRCACMGAVFNLPMSRVTVIENAAMAAMAGAMVF